MTADAGTAGVPDAPSKQPEPGRVPPQTILGERYSVSHLVRRTPVAEVYAATDFETDGQVHVHVLSEDLVSRPQMREVMMSAAREAMALQHFNVAPPIDARFDGQYCIVITAPLQGTSLRELLLRRAETGATGLGPRGVINVADAVCDAMTTAHEREVTHGMLVASSIFIDADGTVMLTDFGMGALIAAAVQSGLVQAPHELAPEVAETGLISTEGDVFGLGMLLYELLLGRPLQRGGPRPSDKVPGLSPAIDQLIAKAASPDSDKRPTLAEFRASLRGAFSAHAPATAAAAGPSLAQSLAPMAAVPAIDPALLADTDERWLISRGKLDYGPFALAEVVEQIRADKIVPGNVIVDTYSGERCSVEEHPLLGALVEQARQARDDRRRANAEVVHAKQEKRRGFVLYAVIAAGAVALGGIAYLVVTKASKEEGSAASQGISTVGEGELVAQIRFPQKSKETKKPSKSGGGGRSSGGDDTLSLDMSDESGGSERLDEGLINAGIQRAGGKLGSCLGQNGGGYAKIEFIIDGPTGKVTSVKVNGQQNGGLYTCVNRVMRAMKFPTIDGPRTRAEFEMEL